LKSGSEVAQGHQYCYRSIVCLRFPISVI